MSMGKRARCNRVRPRRYTTRAPAQTSTTVGENIQGFRKSANTVNLGFVNERLRANRRVGRHWANHPLNGLASQGSRMKFNSGGAVAYNRRSKPLSYV